MNKGIHIPMKLVFRIIALAILFLPLVLTAQIPNEKALKQQFQNNSKHNFFIENKGQWPEEVLFLAKTGGMNAWITSNGVVYDYYQVNRNYSQEDIRDLRGYEKDDFENTHTTVTGQVVDIMLEKANTDARANPSGMQQCYYNYFTGNDSTKWAVNVKLYSEVLMQDVYPGIDIRYYFDNGLIRYDYIARPGADLSKVVLKIKGSDDYFINTNGELSINTVLGSITHGKLFAYQILAGKKSEVACSFTDNNGTIGITAKNYNPALALVIDPLVYSTYLGGSNAENCMSSALDSAGNIYLTGYTYSSNFPVTTGAYKPSLTGSYDAFVTKMNPYCSALLYSTYIGGTSTEYSYSITVDQYNSAYLTGYTMSNDYPTTSGAFDVTKNGTYDVFVSKINATGNALSYSTYIGGTSTQIGYSIAVNRSGMAFITGYTASTNYPTTSGAFSIVLSTGGNDAFVTKLNAAGSALIYSTYLGGNGVDYSNVIKIDTSGNAYVSGYTYSSNFPVTTGAYKQTYVGMIDVYVTKLNTAGSALVYSTYIGGTNQDQCNSLDLDQNGNAYITGYTYSTDYPVTTGAYKTNNNGTLDVFVTKLNSLGTALVYSTYLGGSGYDYGYSIAADKKGIAYITGTTTSTNYPCTAGAYSKTIKGSQDIFFTKLNAAGSGLLYSSYFGGNNSDYGYTISIDQNGYTVVSGYTYSTNYPVTTNAFCKNYSASVDVVVSKFLLIDPATNLNLPKLTLTTANCKWTRGGGIKRAVFVAQTTIGFPAPSDNSTYSANDTFGLGSQIGTSGWYCVYNDTGAISTIKGLVPFTSYRIMVCEYIGSPGNETYVVDSVSNNPCNFRTPKPTQAYNIKFSNYNISRFTATWVNGNGDARVVFVCAGNTGIAFPSNNTTYFPGSIYTTGTQIGTTGWYCVYNGTGNSVSVSGLIYNVNYRVMVCEYYGDPSHEQYLTTTNATNPSNFYPVPSVQASDIQFSGVSTNSMNISWNNGNGTRRAVYLLEGDTGTVHPKHNTVYIPNSVFGSGAEVDSSGWYCIYNGTASMVSVSGLTNNKVYRAMVCEYNGYSSDVTYDTTKAYNNPMNQATGNLPPSVQADKISISNITSTSFRASWTKGNGLSRVVFVKAGNSGAPLPVSNVTYTADTAFGLGSQVGTSGWYCVYNDSGSSVNISNLSAATTYRLMVCEYNCTPGYEKYDIATTSSNPVNVNTDFAAPSNQADGITFTNVTGISLTAKWLNGNGTSREVFLKAASVSAAAPVANTSYNADTAFASGTQIVTSGWYCVYNGTGTEVNIGNLIPLTTYRLMVCEYNGTVGKEKYNTSTTLSNPANIKTLDYIVPTLQAKGITFSNVSTTYFKLSWINGNGTSRAVFVRAGNSTLAQPVNNTTYTANPFYKYGTRIDTTGWYCVYNGTGTTVMVSKLNPNTCYRVMVCEYNGLPGVEKYITSAATSNPVNQFTDYNAPDSQAAGITFTNVTSRSFRTYWTNGNGDKRAIFIKAGTSTGSASPLNSTTYLADTNFGLGAQINTSGWYCIYNGTGTSVSVGKLTPNTSYLLMVCEYNGSAGTEKYNTSSALNNPRSQITEQEAPDVQANNITFTSLAASSFVFSWNRGNGASRVVFVRQGATGKAITTDSTTYTANVLYGYGSQIGTTGWYCVYNDTGNMVSIGNLKKKTTYSVMVCEYNGKTGSERYNDNTATNNPRFTSTTGLDGNKQTEINIFPNPSNGILYIDNANSSRLKIYSIPGKLIYSGTISADHFQVDLNEIENGLYYLKLENSGKTVIQKFLLAK